MATVDDKKIIFSMVGVSKIIPQNQKQILKNIYLSFFYGAKIGIIGLNGAGKSTLMKIIAGLEQPTQGEVVWSPGYSVGYLPQDPPLDENKTVKENVMEGVQKIYDALAEYEDINNKFGLEEYYGDPDKMDKLMQRQAEVQDIIDATDAWNIDSKLERAMDALHCPPGDWPVTNLSGGERRRVALCRLLLQKPDVLLLDEPTNHLDAESIDWLEQHLQQYEGTVIAVTHDRYFLDDVSEWILELDRGEGIPWKGNYSSWLDQKTKRMIQEEKTASKRRKTLERELEWVRMAPKARQAKGKARLNSYEQMLNQEQKEREEKLEIFIPNGPRLGNKVIEAQHVKKAFGEKVLFNDLNFMLPPNGIVGVIGPNGAGKTTLIRIINKILIPNSGQILFNGRPITREDVASIGYMPEERGLYRKMKVGDQAVYLARLKGMSSAQARSELKNWFERFGIQDWWNKKVEELSKGMAQKLQFITTVVHKPSLMILDEPFSGFDPVNAEIVRQEILRLRDGGATIILSTHNMESVEELCDNIALINHSHLVVSAGVEELRRSYGNNNVELVYTDSEGSHTVVLPREENGTSTLKSFIDKGVQINSYRELMPRMNDIFIKLVTQEEKEENK